MLIAEEKEWPPCQIACPVHTNVRAYIELIAAGKYEEAFEVLREANPFPSICSRICPHPCEEECRRNALDSPLAVRDLKRFACEQSVSSRKARAKPFPKIKKEKVAIIGGGPSGLTAALDLTKLGYSVTVFERSPVLGGVLATAIPKYRLPRDMLQEDIDDVLATGIEVRLDCDIGKDIRFDDLKSMGYDAILIGIGLSTSRSLQIPGIDSKGVLLALPFLYDMVFGNNVEIGKDVIVIGGGNVATDVARSALRLGPDSVTMVCLESREEMPAWEWEIEEALEEGIEIICSQGPNKIIQRDGEIAGLEMKVCLSVFDEEGRFNPRYREEEICEIEGDTVIIAIGQAPDLSFVKDTGLLDERGRLIFDKQSMMTKGEGVFTCGEVLTGPGSAIEAVASGHKAAKAIDAYLRGEPLAEVTLEEKTKISSLPEEMYEKVKRTERQKMPVLPPEERTRDFEPFELGLSEKAALLEARRCMDCGAGAECISDKCCACLTCVRVCPFGVPYVTDAAEMPSDKCQACGICAAECPAGAIVMKGYAIDEMRGMVEVKAAAMNEDNKPFVVLFTCFHHTTTKTGKDFPENVIHIELPCSNRISTIDLLKAFEHGAAGVIVVSCQEGECRYLEGNSRIKERVNYVKGMLKEIGFEESRIELYELDSPSGERWLDIANSMLERVS